MRIVTPMGPCLLLTLLAGPAAAQQFRGSGSEATPMFPLAAGLAVFESEHRGNGSFTIRLLDADGNTIGEVANGTGVFGGSKAVRVPQTGRYLLNVEAMGEWSVRLRRNDPEGAAAIDSVQLRGRDDGHEAAGQPGTTGWLAQGFVGGVLLGPIGTAIAVTRAGSSARSTAQEAASTLSLGEPGYAASYREAYADRLSTRRQRSALIGGVLGSVVLGYVLLQALDLGAAGEGVEPPDDNPPALVVPIFSWSF